MDVIDFIMHKENCTKHEAIEKAIALSGHEIITASGNETTTPAPPKPTISKEQFLQNMFTYFKNAVHTSKPAQEYLHSRSLDSSKIEVGYNTGQFHHGTRKDEGLIEQCLQYGLLSEHDRLSRTGETCYKPFAKFCIVFALRNRASQVTGLYFRSTVNDHSGQKVGIWNYWDFNGDLIKTENWFSGKQFGEQIDYYNRMEPNDRPRMYKYSFFNLEGQKIFESKFDIERKLLSAEGSPIYCAYNRSNISAGGLYELICFFGIPPGFKWDFSIKEKEKNNRVLLEKNFSSDSSNNEVLNLPFAKKYLHTKEYLTKGTYTWLLLLQIKSSPNQIVFKDSIKLKVSVQ